MPYTHKTFIQSPENAGEILNGLIDIASTIEFSFQLGEMNDYVERTRISAEIYHEKGKFPPTDEIAVSFVNSGAHPPI